MMMKSSFDYFKRRNAYAKNYAANYNTRFVFEGMPSVEINLENDIIMRACVVNKQEKDMAYVYTLEYEPLPIGTVFIAKGLHFLVIEEITIMQNVRFHKYIALLCNTEFDEWDWGYFKGTEESYINLALKEDLAAMSQQHPILVAKQGRFDINDKIKVNGRPWLIIESDTISNATIGYYSLKSTTMSKEDLEKEDDLEELSPTVDEDNATKVTPLQTIVASTENGYFKCSQKILNLKITSNLISFTVPFGVQDFSIKVMEHDEVKTYNYKVVM